MRHMAKASIVPLLLLTACGGSSAPERGVAPAPTAAEPATPPDVGQFMVTSPSTGETLDSVVVLRAHLMNPPVSGYALCWQVDGGQLNPMTPEGIDRIAYVDVRGWDWSEAGPYFITLVAQGADGTTVGRRSLPIFVNRPGARDAAPLVQMSRDRCAAPVG